jgi:hypothetical protein
MLWLQSLARDTFALRILKIDALGSDSAVQEPHGRDLTLIYFDQAL